MLSRLTLCITLCAPFVAAQDVRYRDEVFSEVVETEDVAYGGAVNRWSNQFETLLLDVYEPAGDPAAVRPAVVVVHGGGFKGGSKSGWRPEAAATAYARRGYVAVSIDYRLAPDRQTVQNNLQVVVQDASHDLKAAVRWLRSQAAVLRIDSARIASFGASAGAATVATSAYSASEGQSGNPGFSSEVACVTSVSGASLSLSELDAGDAPIFLVHGQQDTVVPPQGSVAVYQQALSVGVPTELHLLPGIDHSEAFMAFMQTRLDDAMAFSWQHLRLGALGGLQEIGSVSAPGTAVVRAVGIANDVRWFGVALALQQQPLPGVGDWWLDPASLILMPMTPFAEAPRLPSVTFSLAVPASALGLDVYLQEVHQDLLTGELRLTNYVHLDL